MNKTRLFPVSRHVALEGDRTAGSILIETLVALVLLALIVGPLITGIQTAISRGQYVRTRAEGIAFRDPAEPSREPWSWGPRLLTADWQPGPRLDLTVGEQAAAECVVGLWVDGWFVGEQEPDSEGRLTVERRVVGDQVGAEIVVRVCRRDGLWGPPWRSVVPEPVPTDWPMTKVASGPGAPNGSESAVLHPTTWANPVFHVSDFDAAVVTDGSGLPRFLSLSETGTTRVSLNEIIQEWKADEERYLDLFF